MENSKRKHPLYFAMVAVLLIAFTVALSGCGEDVVIVEGAITVPDDYATIQEAIDAAEDGDVIVIREGTYRESIDFLGKNITLRSADPDDPEVVAATVIDAGGVNSVVTFAGGESQAAVITGFTLTGGSGNAEILAFMI
jgi:pectin methylesterase-like acyl-CoA thioesterase